MTQKEKAEAPIIELRHVDKHYGDLHVLKDINLVVDRGEVVVVIGPSGSGKSTMCRTINRLETIDSGEILIEGEPLPLDDGRFGLFCRRRARSSPRLEQSLEWFSRASTFLPT